MTIAPSPLSTRQDPPEPFAGAPGSLVVFGDVVCAVATPDFGWSLWQKRPDEYPVTSLPAVEAVQAARRQSETAAEELDLALRTALFVRSCCISLLHEVLAAATECPSLDLDRLTADLDAGVARAAVTRQSAAARSGAATCAAYVALPDGRGLVQPRDRDRLARAADATRRAGRRDRRSRHLPGARRGRAVGRRRTGHGDEMCPGDGGLDG